MYNYIFFDLDGTITQSDAGIINSVIYALGRMGIDEEDRESVRRFIGPPLVQAFMDFYGMSEKDAEKATAHYREHYNEGEMYNAPLYDGILDVIRELNFRGKKLFVVTSKPPFFSDRIVEHFGLTGYFEGVIGPDLHNKDTSKAELVRLAILEADGRDMSRTVDPAECLMIGDRFYDIEGANENGVDSIGVTYGYGTLDELKEAGATYIAGTPAEILSFIP
ncbi:MAG: HAD hydrolase-like protein [Lachnospiraceae bacterium]|nr:HAD hydrolase-like protein [Lachnospiraceae bacterium]